MISQRSDRQGNTATVAKGSRCERWARRSRTPIVSAVAGIGEAHDLQYAKVKNACLLEKLSE